MGKKMSKKEFDHIIKDLIGNDKLFGYKAKSEKPYPMYYSKDVFDQFVKDMIKNYPDAHKKYNEGAEGELKAKRYPPKMASVASSSRFCYLALRNGIDITIGSERIKGNPEFEKVCPIFSKYKTHAPHLDAYIIDSNCYFEVKCHEIFDSHKVVMKDDYREPIKDEFGLDPVITPNTKSGTFEIPLKKFGIDNKDTTRFDIKQLICHLLGIAKKKGTNKKLVYLFFRPDTDKLEMSSTINENELEKVFNELQEEIKYIFDSDPIKNFCSPKNHDIKLMAIAEKSSVMEPLTNNNLIIFSK
ncbi:hypothetical protein [Ruminococcus sp. HUN007]|uniref:hypothetical protein n=1 Tax=Ruminococcus sp. HUN007 TaxID=1514668 RepID=UPI0005D26385|nr:hypothetical protein [Ruminococcus sp. HUN007]